MIFDQFSVTPPGKEVRSHLGDLSRFHRPEPRFYGVELKLRCTREEVMLLMKLFEQQFGGVPRDQHREFADDE